MIYDKRALISVSDKSGITELAKALIDSGYKVIASDGTAAYLESNQIPVIRIEEVTGFPELFDGRVKSLHPLIHGAVLFDREDPKQVKEAEASGIGAIDVIVVNLYQPDKFDIGGPALIRAAAKNHKFASILTSPKQYPEFIDALGRGISLEQRRAWAIAALEGTARYDLAILNEIGEPLRYGENPHQKGRLAASSGVAAATLIQGKQPSFNNYLDLDIASLIASDHEECAFVIVKHGMPCGIAVSVAATEAFSRALASDPVSAFGGVIATNTQVDQLVASEIVKNFYEAVIAPSYTEDALKVLGTKPNLRVLTLPSRSNQEFLVRDIDGGFLIQSPDSLFPEEPWTLVAGNQLSEGEIKDLKFAWRAVARCRSNAVLIARNGATVGIGVGEVNRLDAARDAIARAKKEAIGGYAASDGFFPFPDGLEALATAGVKAIVAPGGSIRDTEVIEAAKRVGVTLYFATRRHFSHN